MTDEQIVIERSAGEVLVSGEYSIQVDLLGYVLDLHFHPMSRNKKRMMD